MTAEITLRVVLARLRIVAVTTTEARYGGLLSSNAPTRSSAALCGGFQGVFKELRPHVEALRRRRPFSCGRLFASGLNTTLYLG